MRSRFCWLCAGIAPFIPRAMTGINSSGMSLPGKTVEQRSGATPRMRSALFLVRVFSAYCEDFPAAAMLRRIPFGGVERARISYAKN